MANEVTVTAANVRPLPGAVCRNLIAGVTITLGQLVAIDGTTGRAILADAGVADNAVGVCVAVAGEGAASAAAGDAISVLLWGPVQGFSGMVPGAKHYLSATAGALSTATASPQTVCGVAWAADVFLWSPHWYYYSA